MPSDDLPRLEYPGQPGAGPSTRNVSMALATGWPDSVVTSASQKTIERPRVVTQPS